MLAAGVDIGLHSAKAVIVRKGVPISHSVVVCGSRPAQAVATAALTNAAVEAGIPLDNLVVTITGRGRFYTPIGHRLADSVCLAKAAGSLYSSATLVDIGAEKVLAVKCLGGRPMKSVHNDRCAAGSGLFLELVAAALGVPLELTGELANKSTQEVEILSTCAVFAETEIISLVYQGKHVEDILKGVFTALSRRIYPLLERVGEAENLLVVGGVAGNEGVIKAIETMIGKHVTVPQYSLTFSALGAALLAEETGPAEQ